jgi:hypothetical protein
MRSVQNGTQNCERRTTADIVDGSAPNGASERIPYRRLGATDKKANVA